MRIEVSTTNLELTPVLRSFTEGRVWVALQRLARRPSWVGVRIVGKPEGEGKTRFVAKLDAWVPGVGPVTVCHAHASPYSAVDSAAFLLNQAITRRLRRAGLAAASRDRRPLRPRAAAGASSSDATKPPRLAVVIKPSGGSSGVSLRPWLLAQYGVEEVQNVTLSREAWRRLASGDGGGVSPELRDRLALPLLCEPELVVVRGPESSGSAEWPRTSREHVERAVRRLHGLGFPAELVGVWTGAHEQVGRSDGSGAGHAVDGLQLSVFRPNAPQWVAERVRADDRGRVRQETPEAQPRPRGRTIRHAGHGGRSGMRRGRFSVAHWRRDGGRRRSGADATAAAAP